MLITTKDEIANNTVIPLIKLVITETLRTHIIVAMIDTIIMIINDRYSGMFS